MQLRAEGAACSCMSCHRPPSLCVVSFSGTPFLRFLLSGPSAGLWRPSARDFGGPLRGTLAALCAGLFAPLLPSLASHVQAPCREPRRKLMPRAAAQGLSYGSRS